MMEIIGIGVDIVDVERFRSQVSKQPALLERLLTDTEIAESADRFAKLAGKFAAKEAFIKAAGGIDDFSFHDVQVKSNGERPLLLLSGGCAKLVEEKFAKPHLSISHDGGLAIAYVVLEGAAGLSESAKRTEQDGDSGHPNQGAARD